MIDLHCHILPGVDDGPADLAGSAELARMLVGSGVSTVAATPHLRDDHPAAKVAELSDRCRELTSALAAAGVGLTVVPGGEMDLLWALKASAEELRLASYGQRGTDLLVETPYGPLPTHFEEHLFRLASIGFRILLAHPERNAGFQANPDRLAELVRGGILTQITVGALARSPRKSRSARLARDLLRGGLVHVIASDAHSAGDTVRAPQWESLRTARELVGRQADWMVNDAPRAILEGAPLPPRPKSAEKTKKVLGRSLLGRGFRRG